MIKEQMITNTVIDGKEYTAIALGVDDFAIPRHMMQGEKQDGYIYKNGELISWRWEAFCTIEGRKCFYFDRCRIENFSSIATTHRDNALTLVRDLAVALTLLPQSFVSVQLGLLPTYRFYIYEDDSWLILPPDLGDLFSLYYNDEDRYLSLGCFAKGGTEPSFSLIRQFAQFLYFALTGSAPYQDREIREYNYTEFPLSSLRPYLFPDLSEKTQGFIEFCLHATSKEMRKIYGNRKAEENLKWFVEKTMTLTWEAERKSPEDYASVKSELEKSGSYQKFLKQTSEGAKRNNFWRLKGSVIIGTCIAVILVGAFVISYVSKLLEPPYTKDMNQSEIVYAFYEAQNELDVSDLTAAIKGCKAPQENEVINLFVNRQTRMAYEQTAPVIRADKWVDAGMPSFKATMFVYGADDVKVTEVGENTLRADLLFYSPYNYSSETTETTDLTSTEATTYCYAYSQTFTFAWNDRGWWNIVNITDPEVELVREIKTPLLAQ